MPKRIVILTTGQPATNPRMVKEYLALKEEGYEVKVFYSYWQQWAAAADEKMFATGEINSADFILVGGSPRQNKWSYFATKILQKINQFIYNNTGTKSEAAFTRTTAHLMAAAKNESADLYIAHNAGALPAAVLGAKKYDTKAIFDAEDFHRGEYKDRQSKRCRQLVSIEDSYLPKCSFVTAASPLIEAAYQKLYSQQQFVTINNVFSKNFLQTPVATAPDMLTFFWFSQTIGPHRGLETVVKAMNLLNENCKTALYLMGSISPGFDVHLKQLSNQQNIHFLPPVLPNEVFAEAAKYDIGLSIEVPDFENRDLCLTNKIFTYLLAGNCILFSNTQAQLGFTRRYPDVGFVFEAGNEQQLATIIVKLYNDREKLVKAKQASLQLAKSELNWETEGEKLKRSIQQL